MERAIISLVGGSGEVSECSKVTDSKSVVAQATVGSNPTLSAICGGFLFRRRRAKPLQYFVNYDMLA